MNPVFKSPAFWQPYFTLEPEGVSAEDLAAQFAVLGQDFTVRQKTHTIKKARRTYRFVDHFVEFEFACGGRHSIVVEYQAEVDGCSKEFSLVDASGRSHQLGWWDGGRSHPYCLRPDELDALLRFWERHDARWPEPHEPLLLLCQFVGLEDSAAVKALSARAAAWRALGLPPAKKGHPPVRLEVPETKDYRWERDEELGWVFTSDEYCCYSVRNRAHAGGEEAEFPFTEFARMLEHVRRRNEQDGKGG